MKILVVGGAGYIGSQTVLHLLEKGHEPVVFDNLSQGFERLVMSKTWVKGDIQDQALVEEVLKKYAIEAVMHFAAFASVGESVTNPALYYENNVTGTLSLLAAMKNAKVNTLVFSSTCSTYGMPVQTPISESCPQNPINPYGTSKLVVETILRDYARAYGLSSVSLRYFNACGADLKSRTGELHQPETHLIPLVIQAALADTPVKIFGTDYPTQDGTCIRDYIHTEDLASAHLAALESIVAQKGAEASARYYNLGTGAGRSVREIIAGVERLMGKRIKTIVEGRRAGDPSVLVADSRKANAELSWAPKYSDLETILKTAIQWHQKNRA